MTPSGLLWVGLICCLTALVTWLFPTIAYFLGVDLSASRLLFAFGFFLIVVSTFVSIYNGDRGRD